MNFQGFLYKRGHCSAQWTFLGLFGAPLLPPPPTGGRLRHSCFLPAFIDKLLLQSCDQGFPFIWWFLFRASVSGIEGFLCFQSIWYIDSILHSKWTSSSDQINRGTVFFCYHCFSNRNFFRLICRRLAASAFTDPSRGKHPDGYGWCFKEHPSPCVCSMSLLASATVAQ